MTIKQQIDPFLEDFRRANGKGSLANANIALTNIILILVEHIDRMNQPVPQGFPAPELMEAVHKLHESNYVMDPDYTAIVQHLHMEQPVVELTKMKPPAYEEPKKRGPGRPRRIR